MFGQSPITGVISLSTDVPDATKLHRIASEQGNNQSLAQACEQPWVHCYHFKHLRSVQSQIQAPI